MGLVAIASSAPCCGFAGQRAATVGLGMCKGGAMLWMGLRVRLPDYRMPEDRANRIALLRAPRRCTQGFGIRPPLLKPCDGVSACLIAAAPCGPDFPHVTT